MSEFFLPWFTSKEFSSFSSLFFYFVCRQIFIQQNFFVPQKPHHSSSSLPFHLSAPSSSTPSHSWNIFEWLLCNPLLIRSPLLLSHPLSLHQRRERDRRKSFKGSDRQKVSIYPLVNHTEWMFIFFFSLWSSLSLSLIISPSHSRTLLKTFEEKLLTHLPFFHLFRFHCYLKFLKEENSDCNCLVKRGKWLRKMHCK